MMSVLMMISKLSFEDRKLWMQALFEAPTEGVYLCMFARVCTCGENNWVAMRFVLFLRDVPSQFLSPLKSKC